MAKNQKTIKARTLMSLRAKLDDAKTEGWRIKGDVWRVNGEYCALVAREEG